MKRLLTMVLLASLAVCCALFCAACGEKDGGGDPSAADSAGSSASAEAPKEMDVIAEAQGILSQYELSGGTFYTTGGEYTLDEDLILSYFGDATAVPDFSLVETYALYIDETKPISPCEFGIFKMKDSADAETLKAFLDARIKVKLQNAALYPNMDTSALTSAKVTVKGNYVWYCAVKDANDAIDSSLKGE